MNNIFSSIVISHVAKHKQILKEWKYYTTSKGVMAAVSIGMTNCTTMLMVCSMLAIIIFGSSPCNMMYSPKWLGWVWGAAEVAPRQAQYKLVYSSRDQLWYSSTAASASRSMQNLFIAFFVFLKSEIIILLSYLIIVVLPYLKLENKLI